MVAVVREPGPQFRPMRVHDVEAVAQIEKQAYEFPWTPGIFRDCLRAQYGCWVLAHGDLLLGYGILSVAAEEAHVLNVAVLPSHQGLGHGRSLMRKLLDVARWHRVRSIYLEVRPSNACAIHLYDALGFHEIGRRPNYYPARRGREDAIVMAMEFTAPTADQD